MRPVVSAFVLIFLHVQLVLAGSAEVSASLTELADSAEARAIDVYEAAKANGIEIPSSFYGTTHNEYWWKESTCSVLGRLLNQTEYIGPLEIFWEHAEHEITPGNLEELIYEARAFENWASAARKFVKMPANEWGTIWNLDCVGQFNIPEQAAVPESKSRATFRNEGQVLYVMGDIEPGFAEEFATEIAANPQVSEIALGSSGGSVLDAILAGQMIRALGLNTSLSNNCYSACSLVFLGGVDRTIWSPYPELGLHQIYTPTGDRIPPTDPRYLELKEYIETMGVDSKYVLAAMFSAGPTEMHISDLQSLCRSRVATWIQRQCSADD